MVSSDICPVLDVLCVNNASMIEIRLPKNDLLRLCRCNLEVVVHARSEDQRFVGERIGPVALYVSDRFRVDGYNVCEVV